MSSPIRQTGPGSASSAAGSASATGASRTANPLWAVPPADLVELPPGDGMAAGPGGARRLEHPPRPSAVRALRRPRRPRPARPRARGRRARRGSRRPESAGPHAPGTGDRGPAPYYPGSALSFVVREGANPLTGDSRRTLLRSLGSPRSHVDSRDDGHPFAAPTKPRPSQVVALTLTLADGARQQLGEARPHRRAVRRDARPLGEDRDVAVVDGVAPLRRELDRAPPRTLRPRVAPALIARQGSARRCLPRRRRRGSRR